MVHLIKWQAEEPAQSYRARYFPLAEAYWRREFQLKSAEAQEGEGWSITPDASVQWSEFLMRDPSLTEELSETVGGMVMGMTMGGAETLLSAQTFTKSSKGDRAPVTASVFGKFRAFDFSRLIS